MVLLAQISQQLGPNGSQTIISLPQPLEPFKLNSSDLRVNTFWYMSLGFSITAALGATLVQQWVRDYLQVFQRLSGSLERSRMRQFLFHGLSSNHMPILVECIPAFIHISLFLFFIGLAEKLFATNNTVAITTTTIIGFCPLFYIACSAFPVLYVQTPFHTPLSNVFWKMGQILHPRKYSSRNAKGKMVPVSPNMAKGRLQLAMGHSEDRKMRDTEAIRWVLTKITEDSEFEPFAAGIGGSLATLWGRDIWKSIFRENPGNVHSTAPDTVIALNIVQTLKNRIMHSTHPSTIIDSNPVQALKIRFESLLRSCAVSTFSDQSTRFARACVCIDAVASLTLSFKAESKLDIDNDLMNDVLQCFGDEKKRRDKLVQEAEISSGSTMNLRQLSGNPAMDTSLEIKWKCLVLIGMRKALSRSNPWAFLLRLYKRRGVYAEKYRIYEDEALTSGAREVDHELLKAWDAARRLCADLRDIPEEQLTEDRLNELVPRWRSHIEAMQESLHALNLRVHPSIDSAAVNLSYDLIRITGGALEHLEGIFYEWPSMMNPLTTRAMSEGIDINWETMPPDSMKWFIPHLIPPRLLICHLLVCADPRRRPNSDPSTSRIDLVGLGRLLNNPELQRLFDCQQADEESGLELQGPQPYVNQFWRFEDISKHGGVGFMIEMFFATFRSLEEESVTLESKQHIKATLRAIIDDCGKSEYFKTASRQFLSALRQEINILFYDDEQFSGETNTTPEFIVEMLQDLFDESDED